MLKIKKKNNPNLGDLYGVELINKTWGLVQLCYLVEVDGYYALTFALFDINEKELEIMREKIENYDLSRPFLVATLDENPQKKWKYLGNRAVNYTNVDMEANIVNSAGTWGWYNKMEGGIYPKFESYFGILPWDLYLGKAAIDNHLIDKNHKPENIRYLKDFTKKEIEELGLLQTIKYANRLGELKSD